MNTEQDAYVPGMEHEGITVFMMGTVMVEYNRKPMPLIHIVCNFILLSRVYQY